MRQAKNRGNVSGGLHEARLLMTFLGISLFIVGFVIAAVSATGETDSNNAALSVPKVFLTCDAIASLTGVVTATAGLASFLLRQKKKDG